MMKKGTRVRTRYLVAQRTLIVRLGGRRRVLSSAPQGGGFRHASHILNHQVEPNPGAHDASGRLFADPARFLRRLAAHYDIGSGTVGLMTAVPLTQLVTARVSSGSLWVECFATVGVTNAVRAGEWPSQQAPRRRAASPGTINLIVVTNGSLSDAALVGAVQVATEAKTGVLRDHLVPSCHSGLQATGTGTDAVVIACRVRGEGPRHLYSGTHTILGALIGQTVADCVSRGLEKAKRWREKHR
ncbi:MAG: adenosylcobinamide amidohydrolase [Nitrospira sp.]|nr:adenosylcobinamide amidohydrolase [Nitrospira sp.]